MSNDGDVTYGAHGWDSLTYSSTAKAIAELRSVLIPQDPPPALELGWVEGSQRGDGWLPIPSKSGSGWGFVGATAADYNRMFRQSPNDASTIQGCVGAWEFLNGTPKWLDLVGSNLNDAIAFSAAHPNVICVLRGFYTLGSWPKSHGGDDSVQPRASIIREGTAVSFPPQPFHGTSTGFIVIGALAAAAGAFAAFSALGATTGAVAGEASVDVADVAADVAPTIETTATEASGGIFSGITGAVGDAAGTVGTVTGGIGTVKGALGAVGGLLGGSKTKASSAVDGAPVAAVGGGSSSQVLLLVGAAAVLLAILAARA